MFGGIPASSIQPDREKLSTTFYKHFFSWPRCVLKTANSLETAESSIVWLAISKAFLSGKLETGNYFSVFARQFCENI